MTLIQQDENLSAEQKAAISKSLKDADKELEIVSFKLDRTEKVKRTTAILAGRNHRGTGTEKESSGGTKPRTRDRIVTGACSDSCNEHE